MTQATFAVDNIASQNAMTHGVERFFSLLDCTKNEPAIIEAIVENARFGDIDKVVGQRLKDLGFLPNTAIRIVATGLFGKPPFAVQLASGVQFSLRRDELKKIRCRAL